MAITACGDEYTEEDKEALHEAEKGYDSAITQEVWGEFLEQHMPAVKEGIKENTERILAFEDDPEEREMWLTSGLFGEFSPEEIEAIETEKNQQEVASFRTLSGEFEIRQTPGSHLSIEEVKRIYREETPQCVVQGMRGAAHINRPKEKTGDDGKRRITLGEHRAWQPPMTHSSGEPMDRRAQIFIYRHPKGILEPLEDPQDFAALLSGNQEEIKEALAQKERGTHYHEIGEEIYDTHLTVEEIQECDKLYEEAKKGGWMRKICTHSEPTASQYFCDSYKMFKTNPQKLKELDEMMFNFVQNKVISLEVRDTFASLEDKEE